VTVALEIAATTLLQGGAIPIEAQRLAAQPLISEARCALLRNASWLVSARRNKAPLQFGDRPIRSGSRLATIVADRAR
jgi:hypothetical protein